MDFTISNIHTNHFNQGCTGCDYFTSGWRWTWPDLGTEIRPEPEPDLEELVLRSQNNTSDETNGINNAASCYKETVQFSASFVTSLSVF